MKMQFCSFVAQQMQHPVAEQIIDSHTASPFSNQCAAVATTIKDWIFFSTNSFENFGQNYSFCKHRKHWTMLIAMIVQHQGKEYLHCTQNEICDPFFNWFCFLSNEGPVLELVLCGVSPAGCHRQSAWLEKDCSDPFRSLGIFGNLLWWARS